jgi:hypothetical protein
MKETNFNDLETTLQESQMEGKLHFFRTSGKTSCPKGEYVNIRGLNEAI